MNSEWSTVRVEDIAEKIAMGPFGSSIKVETFVASGLPIISGQHLRGTALNDNGFNFITKEHGAKLKNANVFRGDVIFTHAGNIGQVSYIPETSQYDRYVISQRQFYLRCNTDKILPQFVVYYFQSHEGQHKLLANATQVGVPSIARPSSYLRTIEIPLPPLRQQRIIVSVLETLEHKIEHNRQINQTLEQMAQALFQAWFVDFEPVKAKVAALADGRDPLRAAMATLSGKTDAELDELPGAAFDTLAATAALFPEEMEESAEIPKGWEISDIGQEVAVLGGGTPSTSNADYWNGEFAWVTPKDLSRLADKVLTMTERRITKAGVQNISSGQLPIGTVLLSSRAPIGYLALTTIPVSINQGFIAMVCSRRLPNMYVLQWATQNLDAIKQRGSGTTFAEISKGNFRPMPILVPDEKALSAYQEFTLPLYEQITTNLRETDTLATLRDSLLPKLLSGELAVTPEEQGPERRGIEKGVREGRGIERTWD